MFVTLGLAVFLFTRLDDEIRRQVQIKLAEQFPQFNISVGGARLVEGQGISIYDLTISETSSTQLQSNLLVVDEIMLACDAQLTKLVKGLPEVRRVVVRHPQIWAAKGQDDSWNLSSLWPLPECGHQKPQIVIENAQFTLADQSHTRLPAISLRDVNLTINAAATTSQRADLTRTSAKPPANPPLEIRGTLGGPNVERAQIQARFNPTEKSLHVSSQFEQLKITKGLLAWAAALAGKSLGQTSLQGQVDGEVIVEHHWQAKSQPRINAKLQLHTARLVDPRLPAPLVDLSCKLRGQNDLLTIEQLRGSCGSAQVSMQLQRRGWTTTAPVAVGLRVENITLDKKVYGALPQALQTEWNKYLPSGIVDADVQATFDGRKWLPTAKLSGRELAFESDKFRYRVNNGYGTIQYTPEQQNQPATLDIDLVGYGGGQPLRFVGQVFDPRPGALGWLEVTGNEIEIEKRMIAALPEKTRRVIQSMHPHGKFNLHWRLDRNQPEQFKPHTSLRLELVDCRVNYDKFKYPLSGIQGLILAENRQWTFRDLVATGSRRVECQGYLQPGSRGNELLLHFTGEQIPLDDDLRQALPPAAQQAWNELRPRGNVDFQADISHVSGLTQPRIHVAVNPRPESTTIQPKFFPYLMEKLAGTCSYQDGTLLISQLRASHGRTEVRTNGSGQFRPDGSWSVQLEGLAVDRLLARRDLTDALPPKLQRLINSLQPSGKFSLSNGFLKFSRASANNPAVDSEWDIQLNCLQADLQAGVELKNVHGAVRLVGASRGDKSHSAGEVAIDTATFQDVQFTQIRGPLWVDAGQCVFGSGATRRQGLPLRRMKANVYDGEIIADIGVSLDVVPEYSAVAMLTGANLQRLMVERGNGQLDYQGQLGATLTLSGKGRSLATLNGHGEVQVTKANIYQLPLLVSMLKVLRNETPDSTAFNEVNSKFRIQGRHIYLDQLDFKGDAVTLKGRGETNFDQTLDLDFHAVIGRDEIRLPLVKNIVNRVGQHTLQMTVNGTLSNPLVNTQALPGINQFLKRIQGDLDINSSPASTTEPRKAERVLPTVPPWGRR